MLYKPFELGMKDARSAQVLGGVPMLQRWSMNDSIVSLPYIEIVFSIFVLFIVCI